MLSDARELASDQQIDADVCIVGAGPAGISIARELIGNGASVWLLESGGKDVERRAQRLNWGQSVGYPIHRPHQSRVRAFGGTSRHWFSPGDESWAARPLDPVDFEVRPGIRYSGWPFDRAHLDPYYAHAQALCRLGPFDYDPGRWADPAADAALAAATGRGRDHAVPARHRRLRRLLRGARPRAERDAAAARLGRRPGDRRGPGRVDRVEVRRDDGSRCFVRARLVVLAAGGIENPRLLLLSRRVHRRGLGNDRDLVGRFFAERLSARTGYIVPATARPGRRRRLVRRPCGRARGPGAGGAAGPRRGAARAAAPQLRVLPADPEPVHHRRGGPVVRDPGQGPPAPAAAGRDARAPAQRRDRPRRPRRLRP